jgi:hypothetical protein
MKKYKLGKREGNDLCRVIALRDFADVKKGDIGGRIQSKENLSHEGDAQVSGNAQVYGDAQVSGNAQVYGDAQVSGNALVYGDAWVSGDAQVTRGPINVIMKPFSITITDNHVQVGCELLRKDHLAQDGLTAAKKYNLDKKTVAKYRAIIKALMKT